MTCNKFEFEFFKEIKPRLWAVAFVCIFLLLCENRGFLSHQYNNQAPNTESKQNNLIASGGSKLSYPTIKLELNKDEIKPTVSNRTKQNILIYNRVPKCASSLFQHLLRKLKTNLNNHFKSISWKVHNESQLTIEKEAELLDWVTVKQQESKLPLAYDRHFYFIDTSIHGIQKGDYQKFYSYS